MLSSKNPLLKANHKAFVLSKVNREPDSPGIKELYNQVEIANGVLYRHLKPAIPLQNRLLLLSDVSL